MEGPGPVRTFEVTRELRCEGADRLHSSARHAPDEFLTGGNLAALLRSAGLPCVTLTTAAGAAAEPATTKDEGLRIVKDSCPARVFYPIPSDNYAALRRRDGHLMWLADFAERQRWSTTWLADGSMTVHPEPWPATYMHNGAEVFRATGRRADEDLGSWVVLWIVDNAQAWADAIEAEVTREIHSAPKNHRYATYMQQQRLDGAARIREEGPRRTVRSVEYDQARADAHVADLYRAYPNPGVRYEAAPITATAGCTTCFCPMIQAGYRWWHHTGGYPAECPGPREARSLPLEPGEWEMDSMSMTCGYCGQCVSWPETQRSWARLTGVHSLGVHRQTGELVVLAEAIGIAARPGELGHLAHHCTEIPDSVRAEYAADVRAVTKGAIPG
jgi:hypothetical protein